MNRLHWNSILSSTFHLERIALRICVTKRCHRNIEPTNQAARLHSHHFLLYHSLSVTKLRVKYTPSSQFRLLRWKVRCDVNGVWRELPLSSFHGNDSDLSTWMDPDWCSRSNQYFHCSNTSCQQGLNHCRRRVLDSVGYLGRTNKRIKSHQGTFHLPSVMKVLIWTQLRYPSHCISHSHPPVDPFWWTQLAIKWFEDIYESIRIRI